MVCERGSVDLRKTIEGEEKALRAGRVGARRSYRPVFPRRQVGLCSVKSLAMIGIGGSVANHPQCRRRFFEDDDDSQNGSFEKERREDSSEKKTLRQTAMGASSPNDPKRMERVDSVPEGNPPRAFVASSSRNRSRSNFDHR